MSTFDSFALLHHIIQLIERLATKHSPNVWWLTPSSATGALDSKLQYDMPWNSYLTERSMNFSMWLVV